MRHFFRFSPRWVAGVFLVLSACADAPGEDFAELHATLEGRYAELKDRAVEGGWQKLSSNYQIRLFLASAGVSALELWDQSETVAAGTFDPALPPPGYSLCHNGHCHRDDGALVPYEEVAAAAGGTGGTSRLLVSLSATRLDLLSPAPQPLECDPDCQLPRGDVASARGALTTLQLQGEVRDTQATPRFAGARRFTANLAGGEEGISALEETLNIPLDRAHEPRLRLAFSLLLNARLFDEMPWAEGSLNESGEIDLMAPANAALRETLLKALDLVSLHSTLLRDDPS